jgi:outer membrane biosynthesis protein TonB
MRSPASEGGAAAPIHLSPESYPLKAHREKIDGSVAMAVSVDAEKTPTVLCIHHASPSGHGFELPAIEAVRSWNGDMLALENAEAGSLLTVLVDFSRASARRKPIGVEYH